LGGVARKTRETIILCEAAGFDIIFIETVGVGQSETVVHSMVDFFLLLVLAGAGDELQGIKRGIMEMADAIAITKADQSNIQKAEQAKSIYHNALHLFPLPESKWNPQVVTCSAINHAGTEEIWNIIIDYFKTTQKNGYFQHKRQIQSKYWFHETIDEYINKHFYDHPYIKSNIAEYEEKVLEGKMTSTEAALRLLNYYFSV
jgi:LAO/AO transport system kinase